ncbi:unnamed protein product [Caenorhabditis angaria]|uniref:WW domain-containing protein n=1 Tax=Caenorhabditis angaria TaxID=860376 RepID=A0A9P1IBF6_9PELO|nr:unnamed protein product [Caenorhabditis angaria]
MGVDQSLIKNAQNQLDRLMKQLAEIEEEKESLEEEEYLDMKKDTIEQLENLGKTLEKFEVGSMTLIDELTATKLAIRAAISAAFKTPEVIALFARKQPGLLRERLMMLDTNLKLQKIAKHEYFEKKLEILIALKKLKDPLSEEESKFVNDALEDKSNFNLEVANFDSLWRMSTKERRKEEEKDLPPNWQAYFHKTHNKVFYWNVITKESTYEKPKIRSPPKKSKRKRDKSPEPEVKRSKPEVYPTRKRKNLDSVELCVVIDTNVLIDSPDVLKEVCKKKILTIIPYTVISELNGLKSRNDLLPTVNKVCRNIENLRKNQEEYVYLELESAIEQIAKLDDFVETSDNDDKILKCAMRIRKELSTIPVILLTNDVNLRVKAEANSLRAMNLTDFSMEFGIVNDEKERRSKSRSLSVEKEDSMAKVMAKMPYIPESDDSQRSRSSTPQPSSSSSTIKIDLNRFSFRQLLNQDMETETIAPHPQFEIPNDEDEFPCVRVIRRSKSPQANQKSRNFRNEYRDNPKLANFLKNAKIYNNKTREEMTTAKVPTKITAKSRIPCIEEDEGADDELMDCS